jgi:hypothetical protein
MLSRLAFIVITGFWITMNVLLWRSEFRGKNELGSAVPVPVVWQKMLTAPDDSRMEVLKQGREIGSFRWSPNVGEAVATGKTYSPDAQPEGRVQELSGYTIDIMEGSLEVGENHKRVYYTFSGQFSTNHQWQEFNLRFTQRRASLELHGVAGTEKLDVHWQDEAEDWQRTFTFAELRDPEKLLQDIAGPLPLGMLFGGLTAGFTGPAASGFQMDMKWEARFDWLKIGHSNLRVYRLQGRLANRYDVVLHISRLGEILRVELPNGVRILNTRLSM